MKDRTEYFRQYQRDSHYRMFMRAIDMFEEIEKGLTTEQQYDLDMNFKEAITFEL